MRYSFDVGDSTHDTTREAAAMQVAVYRRMSPTERVAIAARMSMAARAITLEGIRRRHPDYDEQHARWALFRMLHGDELFGRAWPAAPVLEP